MFEPREALDLGQSVQVAIFDVSAISHPELGDRGRFLPFVHEPHSSREQLASLVHVAKVRRAQRHKAVELVLDPVEIGQCSSCDDSSE